MELTTGHKTLLKKIKEHQNPTTPDLKKDEDVAEHYSPKSVGPTLRKLKAAGYVESDGGRPARYSLTEDGNHLVKQMMRRKHERLQRASQEENGLSFDVMVDEFTDYFQTGDVEEQLVSRSLDGKCAIIDYQKLDRFAPEITDMLMEQPDEVIEAAEVAISNLSAVEGSMDIRITNLPDYRHKEIREIGSKDIGKLVTVPGIVLKASKARPILVEAKFECCACGDIYEKEQKEGKTTSPYKCDCGNRRFTCIERSYDDVKLMKLQEKPDSPDKKTAKIRAFGSIANEEVITEMKPGTPVRITGVVEAEEPTNKNDPYHDWYISAIDVDPEENKWDEIEVTEADKRTNQKISTHPVEAFQKSLAMGRVLHRDLMKEAYLLYLLGKTDDGNINVLVMGEPGTGKSELVVDTEKHFPKTILAVATPSSMTGVGLTATVKEDKDFGGYVAQGGSLTLADGGYHITDEFDKIDSSDIANFNEALANGTITLNKGDIVDLKLDANVSEWAVANPRDYDYFDPEIPKFEQIPIPPNREATKDRFDVIIGVTRYHPDSDKKREVAEHILRRSNKDFDGTVPEYTYPQLVKFVTQAASIDPEMTPEAEDAILEAYFSLKNVETATHRLITNRRLIGLKKLSIAYARAHLCDEVTKEHAAMACDFFKRSLESIDFSIGKDSFGDMGSKEETQVRRLKKAVDNILEGSDDRQVSVEDISAETGWDTDRVERVAAEALNQGEIYEHKSGLYKSL